MMVELLLLILLLILLYFLALKSKKDRLYEKIPGPKPYPFIGNIFEFTSNEEVTDTFKRLSFQYGPVYRVTIGMEQVVCLRKPEDIEMILGSNVHINKAPLYWPLLPWLNEGLLTSGDDYWRKHRKILTPAFHFNVLEKFVKDFKKHCSIFVDKLSQKAGMEFDVMPLVGLCSLDIICETSMGLQVEAQIKESDYVTNVNELLQIMSRRNFSTAQRTPLFHLMPVGRRHNKLVKYLHNITENVMKERKKILDSEPAKNNDNDKYSDLDIGLKKRKAFLDLLLEYNKEGAGMTDLEIREEVDTFLFEGYDTTTSTTAFALYNLSQNQEVQDRVYDEILNIFGDSDRDATYQDFQEMKYLEKVIKESLRIYSTVQFFGRIAKTDIELSSGYTIPEGSSILILSEAMNHDPELYPEPFKFNPERFDKRNHPYSFLPFSAGPRNCIGQKFALLELKAVISYTLRKFHLLPSDVPITPMFNVVLKSRTGIHLRVEPRKTV